MARKRRRKKLALVWRETRRTRNNRKVEESVAVPWTTAKGGLSKWTVRNKLSDKIRLLAPARHSHLFIIDFRFQFQKRKIIEGHLEVVPDPRAFRKRVHHPVSFKGTKSFREGLNVGAWQIYRHVVRSLLIGNQASLPSYAKRARFRRYRLFCLRVRIERIKRPKRKKKKRLKKNARSHRM